MSEPESPSPLSPLLAPDEYGSAHPSRWIVPRDLRNPHPDAIGEISSGKRRSDVTPPRASAVTVMMVRSDAKGKERTKPSYTTTWRRERRSTSVIPRGDKKGSSKENDPWGRFA